MKKIEFHYKNKSDLNALKSNWAFEIFFQEDFHKYLIKLVQILATKTYLSAIKII